MAKTTASKAMSKQAIHALHKSETCEPSFAVDAVEEAACGSTSQSGTTVRTDAGGSAKQVRYDLKWMTHARLLKRDLVELQELCSQRGLANASLSKQELVEWLLAWKQAYKAPPSSDSEHDPVLNSQPRDNKGAEATTVGPASADRLENSIISDTYVVGDVRSIAAANNGTAVSSIFVGASTASEGSATTHVKESRSTSTSPHVMASAHPPGLNAVMSVQVRVRSIGTNKRCFALPPLDGYMSRKTYRSRLKAHGLDVQQDQDILHIVSVDNGGADHTDNYWFAMGRALNIRLGAKHDHVCAYMVGLLATEKAVARSREAPQKGEARTKAYVGLSASELIRKGEAVFRDTLGAQMRRQLVGNAVSLCNGFPG
eukprot:jgi/Chlat1/4776/Chrsp308S04733